MWSKTDQSFKCEVSDSFQTFILVLKFRTLSAAKQNAGSCMTLLFLSEVSTKVFTFRVAKHDLEIHSTELTTICLFCFILLIFHSGEPQLQEFFMEVNKFLGGFISGPR